MKVTALDPKIVEIFCSVYGQKYKGIVTLETSMDDVPEWDSSTYLDLVFALEESYRVQFTDEETTQMFQIGHIQRLVRAAVLELPHADEANACCLIHNLRHGAADSWNLLLMSGSSTREGILRPREAEEMLQGYRGPKARFYNASVSGLVPAETLQLLDTAGKDWNGVAVIGTSAVIYAGCGVAEFNRSARLERFPFVCPQMKSILDRHGFTPEHGRANVPISLDLWIERYLKGRDLLSLQYEPYIYPTLAPWPPERFSDVPSILRFYNQSVLNFEQSMTINAEFYEAFADWSERTGIPLVMLDLTLQSEMKSYLESIGRVVSRYDAFIDDFSRRRSIPVIDAVTAAGITDADYRDPAHIFRKRDDYTRALFEGLVGIP
jgi:acyl carrier protein